MQLQMTMRKNQLVVAFFQQDIAWENPSENYARVESAFADALRGVAADILVAPETFSTGFSDRMALLAEPSEGESLCFARSMALRHDALFVASWPVREADGRIFNRLHLVRPDGSYDCYDKAHTFRMSSEASQLDRGSSKVVVSWRGWNIRPAVCYDLRFPKWLRNEPTPDAESPLAYDLMLLCANWPASRSQTWTTLLQARAIENEAYVLGVNRVGVDGLGIAYSGNSAAFDFRGRTLQECAPSSPQVALATLDLASLDNFRHHWPFYLDFD